MLVPTTMEDLYEANITFDHAPGKQGIGGKGALLGYLGAIHIENVLWFIGYVDKIGDRGLHSPRHFILGDTSSSLRIAIMVEGLLVDLSDRIEHFPTNRVANAGWIREEQDRITTSS